MLVLYNIDTSKPLGKGAFGEVWKASKAPRNDEFYAIKKVKIKGANKD